MSKLLPSVLVIAVLLFGQAAFAQATKPLKALLIAGGCCHDYPGQHKVLSEGIQARANVQVDVIWTDDTTTKPPLALFENPNWADGYDVIIHDECAADNKSSEAIKNILTTHQKIPAVHLHCAMHSFRDGSDNWPKHLGIHSTSHGPQEPIAVRFLDSDHPITKTLSDWTTIKEELYNNVKVYDITPLARGKQVFQRNGKEVVDEHVVVWTNERAGARSFSTTLGHNTKTVEDPRYLELLTRGLLWSCDKLNDDYLKPFTGKNTVKKIEKPVVSQAPPKKKYPDDGRGLAATVSASSEETGKDNYAWNAIDDDLETRWCASNGDYPQTLTLKFPSPQKVNTIKVDWESQSVYRYRVEGTADGDNWNVLLDRTNNREKITAAEKLDGSMEITSLRIVGVGGPNGGWCSIREVKLTGDKFDRIELQEGCCGPDPNSDEAIYKRQGNIPPRIEKLSAEQEAEILKDVKVADGFEVTLFAAPPAVNYPVFVAAAPDGTVFVSSDGNGSLGRNAKRGRIIRLKDTDGDGRADETKVFCEVDAPRGLIWDKDRLYLMHPPHLSVYIDRDGDGVADEEKVLVKNLAFAYDKRPADHTTNGLSMGVDGWIYIAGGDFGFTKAEGADGRTLTHRGGGVIRVRPDGTGLELYATGTRNILEVAISPTMDLFTRDNTNDGDGWNVRFHHLLQAGDHGYPKLYKNFADEALAPLADYGGGSGCGAVYIDEPGFEYWNNAPFTADWGTGAIYHHWVEPNGATFKETRKPEPFIRMTRPTDADVDANSRVYAASWKGATFDWAGPNVGYIVCVKPKGFKPEPLPDFAKASEKELKELLSSNSYRRRIEAQRELTRRGKDPTETVLSLLRNKQTTQRQFAAELPERARDSDVVLGIINSDPVVRHIAINSAAKRMLIDQTLELLSKETGEPAKYVARALGKMHYAKTVDGLIATYNSAKDPQVKSNILSALCRLYNKEADWDGESWGTRPDTRGPYYKPVTWSESPRILAFLDQTMNSAGHEQATFLLTEMARNRINVDKALTTLIAKALKDDSYVAEAVSQLAKRDDLPAEAEAIAVKAVKLSSSNDQTLLDSVDCLTRIQSSGVLLPILEALARLDANPQPAKMAKAIKSIEQSRTLETSISQLQQIASSPSNKLGVWVDVVLLSLANGKQTSVEGRTRASDVLTQAWAKASRRPQLLNASLKSKNVFLEDQILETAADSKSEFNTLARQVKSELKLKDRAPDRTPVIKTLKPEEAIAQAVSTKGDLAFGERLFVKANCVGCHAVTKDARQIGPYLGNIAKTYKRPQLAEAIVLPNKTIAQGFATITIATSEGKIYTGFVVKEEADRVVIRDANAAEFVIPKGDIEERANMETSIMPESVAHQLTVFELASLVDYLEEQAKHQ
jgi:putative membrane-bound dehydrogenase-like protein